MMKKLHAITRGAALVAGLTALCLAASGCTAGGGASQSGKVTITLAGPNQWNDNASSFGPAWEDLVARFEKAEPNITVKTTVLPLAQFSQTISTQLAAGTAPDLVFNQAPHKPSQVVALDKYLSQPNPYVPGNRHWMDIFNPTYFGPDATLARNTAGNFEWVPFNLVIFGLYYNKDAFHKAGITAPIKSVGDLMRDCGKLKSAGYTPLAMDNGYLGQLVTADTIESMLLAKYADQLNQYAADGNPGKGQQVTEKSMAKAVLTGALDATKTPEIAESLKIAKRVFDGCATQNWSGVTQASAAFVGGDQFTGGKAAMAYGTNFAATNLEGVGFKYGTMPFPTVTTADSKLSIGQAAQFGASPGGTSYMIPATTTGAQRAAAVKFLQYVTSPKGGQPWLDKSGGIPATKGGKAAPGLEGLMAGSWFTAPKVPGPEQFEPKAKKLQSLLTGYLIGSKSLGQELSDEEADWKIHMQEDAVDGGWKDSWVGK